MRRQVSEHERPAPGIELRAAVSATQPVRVVEAPPVDDPWVVGVHVDLWAVQPRFVDALHTVLMHPTVRSWWRSAGQVIAEGDFPRFLSDGVVMQAVITEHGGQVPLGIVELTDASAADRRAQLTLAVAHGLQATGVGLEAAGLFLREAFARFPLDKVCVMTFADNRRLAGALARLFPCEGMLLRHVTVDGDCKNVAMYAIWRDDFARVLAGESQPALARLWRSDAVRY
jgi:RimJ/RimL family protein N-acetyltransferase